MSHDQQCPRCSRTLPPGAPSGLCSACLMEAAFGSAEDVAEAEFPEPLPANQATEDDPIQFGGYELLSQIARGGMGLVWKARQSGLGRLVALKMISSGRLATSTEKRRFLAEAEAAARLDHPGIVPVYEVGEEDGQLFFTMRLIEGGSLAHWGKNQGKALNGTAKARAVAELMARIARAVHHAHERGVLHRDLKPANILLDADGSPLVTDFGLAKWLDRDSSLTATGAAIGTPYYMAPEQAAGKEITTGADVYSLGAILYELLAGKPPFTGATPVETLRRVIDTEPEPPSSINAAADRELGTIALKCLEKKAEGRYFTAAALADDLERWLRGEPIQARAQGPWTRTWKWVRRHPAQAVASAAAAFLAIGGPFVYMLQNERDFALEQKSRADKEASAADLSVAGEAIKDGNLRQAIALLAQQPPDVRSSFPWRMLAHEAHGVPAEILQLSASVDVVCLNQDGATLFVAGERFAELYTLKEGKMLSRKSAPFSLNHPTNGSLTETAQFAALGSKTEGIEAWNLATGTRLWKMPTPWTDVRFAPEGKVAVIAQRPELGKEGGKVAIIDATNGSILWEPADSGGLFALSPDGKTLLTGSTSNGVMTLWDVEKRAKIEVDSLMGNDPNLQSLAAEFLALGGAQEGQLSPKWALTAHRAGRAVLLWDFDPAPGEADVPASVDTQFRDGMDVAMRGQLQQLFLTSDGKWAAQQRRWPTMTFSSAGGSQTRTKIFSGPQAAITAHAFSNDQQWAATAAADGTIRLWRAQAWLNAPELRLPAERGAWIIAPDGRSLIVSLSDGKRGRYHLSGNEVGQMTEIQPLEPSSPEKTALESVALEQKSEATLPEMNSPWRFVHASHLGGVTQIIEAPDHKTLASVGLDDTLRLWDIETKRELALPGAGRRRGAKIAFSANGECLVCVDRSGRIAFWLAPSGQSIPFTHANP